MECDSSCSSDVLTSLGGTLSDTGIESSGTTPEPLLRYFALTYDDRVTLLNEIYMGHREANLSDGDLARLRVYQLFTSYPAQQPTSLSEFDDIYYCIDESVLQTLNALSDAASVTGGDWVTESSPTDPFPPSPPNAISGRVQGTQGSSSTEPALTALSRYSTSRAVIVVNAPRLLDLYRLLKVEQLTEASAVRKFIVPALNTMSPAQRVVTMRQLASRWESYKDDKELVDTLKTVRFVPMWNSTHTGDDTQDQEAAAAAKGGAQTIRRQQREGGEYCMMRRISWRRMSMPLSVRSLRTAREVFSWKIGTSWICCVVSNKRITSTQSGFVVRIYI